MNYIRYWQASGESLKTSVRVKMRLSQLTEEGLYTGGSVPFGYKLEKKGRVNKRNREVYDLAVDENEAEIIRLIFHKYVDEGYGAQRLCRFLHDNGMKSRDGKGFPNTSLNRIIKNGDSQSQYIDELRIIDDNVFARAQEIMRQRTQPHSSIPLNCKGKSLLVGNIYCAHCGNRLTLITSGRNKKMPDSTIQKEVLLDKQKELVDYKSKTLKVIRGQSKLNIDLLNTLVAEAVSQIQEAQASADTAEAELQELLETSE